MLEYILKEEVNPIKEASELLGVPGARAIIQSNSLKISSGAAKKEDIQNYLWKEKRKYTKVIKIDEKGERTNFGTGKYDEDRHINKYDVYMISFEGIGAEFKGIHPGIVIDKSSNSRTYRVLPCSTNEQTGRTVTIQFAEALREADENFIKKSNGETTWVLLEDEISIDRVRFIDYLGNLNEAFINEIESKRAGGSETRCISLESMEITENQQKLLEKTKRLNDIMAIANNDRFTYEQRVRALVSIWGFNIHPKSDSEKMIHYLLKLISNTRWRVKMLFTEEMKRLASDSELAMQVFKTNRADYKLIQSELVGYVIRNLNNDKCLFEFVSLINKLAG